MGKPKKRIIIIILTIFFAAVIFIAILFHGYKMVWGFKRETVTYKELSTSEQLMLDDSLKKVTGKQLTIKKITHTEYKNGVVNYVIRCGKSEKLDIELMWFHGLHDQYAGSDNETGYYYKNKTLYLVIADRDYSTIINNKETIIDEKEKEILKALGELVNAFSEVFENN